MKKCSRCKIQKDYTQFRLHSKYKDGFFSWCKQCEADYQRLNKDAHNLAVRNHTARNKDKKSNDAKKLRKVYRELEKVPIISKKCSTCKEIKDPSSFVKCASNKDGFYYSCKSCSSIQHKRSYKKHRQSTLAKSRTFNLKRKQRVPKWADIDAIHTFYKNCPKGYHVDHIIPLNGKDISGLHVIENLQYLPKAVNLGKSNKFNIEDCR